MGGETVPERDVVRYAPELIDDRSKGARWSPHLFRKVLRDRFEVACIRHRCPIR